MDTAQALAEARTLAAAAAERAGVVVRPVTATADLAAVEALLAAVWQHPPGSVELDITLLAALARTGNYVAGAFRGDDLVGATVGFRAEPFPVTLHSHVTGVDRDRAARGTGGALKAHQRQWCLERGITAVRWTVDPLQARNARLNVHRLGAGWVEFTPDYYGDLVDGLNRGAGSDRLLLEWDLTRGADGRGSPRGRTATTLRRGTSGEPIHGGEPAAYQRLEIPRDIDRLRAQDPATAQRWREALGALLPDLIAAGRPLLDFDDDGAYVVGPPPEESA